MNKRTFWSLAALIALLFLALLVYQLQKQRFIDAHIQSPDMQEQYAQTGGEPKAVEKIPYSLVAPEGNILYNLRYYPETQTIICTITKHGQPQDPGYYLVRYDNSQCVQGYALKSGYGVQKLVFEGAGVYDYQFLDIIDQSAQGDRPYDPVAGSDTDFIRFDLLSEEE